MISILIPLYNYDVTSLVKRLVEEAHQLSIHYEILIQDDASPQPMAANALLNDLPEVTYERSPSNLGRPKTRQLLAEKAKYDRLLFLDVDVFPVYEDFLKRYVDHGLKEFAVIAGGIAYQEEAPSEHQYLRWYYGRQREMRSVFVRNENPYIITPANLFIRKETFLEANQFQGTLYGMDLALSYQLKKMEAPILHIENPVYHLGLESNEEFMTKALSAVENLVSLEKEGGISDDFTTLQKTYKKLKRWGLHRIVASFGASSQKTMQQNLSSKKPNLRLFDLYRMYHYIRLKS